MVAIKERPGLTRKKVTVRRGGKTFEQFRWVKDGEDEKKEKKEEPETHKIDMNVLVEGKLPSYKSMPSNIKISKEEIKKMDDITKESGKIEKEIATPINFIDNKMSIGEKNIGSENTCSVGPGVDTYAIYHTHPDTDGIKPLDSFSLEDIMLVTTRHRLQRTNIMMAHTVRNNNLWTCVPSSETMGEIDKGMQDIMGMQKFVSEIQSECETAIMEKNDKRCRKAIKKYCDRFKMKLYAGNPEDLKEYDGKW